MYEKHLQYVGATEVQQAGNLVCVADTGQRQIIAWVLFAHSSVLQGIHFKKKISLP